MRLPPVANPEPIELRAIPGLPVDEFRQVTSSAQAYPKARHFVLFGHAVDDKTQHYQGTKPLTGTALCASYSCHCAQIKEASLNAANCEYGPQCDMSNKEDRQAGKHGGNRER